MDDIELAAHHPELIPPMRKGLRWLVEQLRNGDRTQCWEYPFCRNDSYGNLMFRSRNDRGHRVAWMIEHERPLPTDRSGVVMHECDNPPCCNPAHLTYGVQSENIGQARARHRLARGEEHGLSQLTGAQVSTIRERHAAGESQTAIAADFGVSQPTVSKIVHRKVWTHVA